MSALISYMARLGIVRVLSVPTAMVVLMCLLWMLAAPPEDLGDDGGETNKS
jgi:hypothetical protein